MSSLRELLDLHERGQALPHNASIFFPERIADARKYLRNEETSLARRRAYPFPPSENVEDRRYENPGVSDYVLRGLGVPVAGAHSIIDSWLGSAPALSGSPLANQLGLGDIRSAGLLEQIIGATRHLFQPDPEKSGRRVYDKDERDD